MSAGGAGCTRHEPHTHSGHHERTCGCHHHSEHRHEHACGCRCEGCCGADAHGGGGHGGGHGSGGGTGGNPNRPGKTVGTSRGRLPSDQGLSKADLTGDHPKDSWAGERKDLYLPYLFLRANAGDTGTRPVAGAFWESPDVLILAGVEPSSAPPVPPTLGQTAAAGEPNTVYAHVWNFGQSAAPQTVVEFYWCDPSLGIGPQSAQLIGQSIVSLGARGSGHSHAVVKCPEAWTPTFLNGGHECLLVRAWDYTSDALGTPSWDASLNRHIGQRNIHVVSPGPLMMMMAGPLPLTTRPPLLLKVGPLYGEPADVTLERVAPASMPWLQLHTGMRGLFPTEAMPTGTALLSKPGSAGGGVPTGGAAITHQVTGDDQQIAFSTTDALPAPGEAHVYRVSASQSGQVFGGYTVVLLGS